MTTTQNMDPMCSADSHFSPTSLLLYCHLSLTPLYPIQNRNIPINGQRQITKINNCKITAEHMNHPIKFNNSTHDSGRGQIRNIIHTLVM